MAEGEEATDQIVIKPWNGENNAVQVFLSRETQVVVTCFRGSREMLLKLNSEEGRKVSLMVCLDVADSVVDLRKFPWLF